MEKVGVEAVVEGLSSFINDTGKINSALDGIRPKGTMLQRVFEGITNTLGAFGREILNVAEYALGHLLADAIEFVVTKIKELISATIEAGAEFQTMSLRLNRLNLNTLIEGGMEFSGAMAQATTQTKEQLVWLQKLAVTTPYDAADIANVFTLARSYGFASDAAQKLTQDITNFASGMGLGNTEIQRIIVNFGQMVQQGKVTQREMNDLARGAFVPVNDIVKRMGENVSKLGKEDMEALSKATGISVAALKKLGDGSTESGKNLDELRKNGESVNLFMQAFSDIVEERFTGAAQEMARTWQGATANLQDFVKSILGMNVVKGVLDEISGKIADVLAALSTKGNFAAVSLAAERFGKALSDVIGGLLGLGNLNTESIVQRILTGFNKMTAWLQENKGKILAFFIGIGTTIQTRVVPFIKKIIDAFNTIRDWVKNNRETISQFFTALGNIIAKVFNFNVGGGGGGFLEGFLAVVTQFMGFVITNQDAIAQWAELILKAFIAFQVLSTILVIIGGIIAGVIGFFLGLVAAITGVVAVVAGLVAAVATPIGAVVAIIVAAIVYVISMFTLFAAIIFYCRDTITAFVDEAKAKFAEWQAALTTAIVEWAAVALTKFEEFKAGAVTKFEEFKTGILEKIAAVVTQFREQIEVIKNLWLNAPWGSIGRLIIDGIRAGVMHAASALASAAAAAVTKAINAAKAAAGIKSPSREGIYIGEMTMAGIAKGISDNANIAMRAMEGAVKTMAMPAMNLPAITQQYAVAAAPSVSNTNNYTNNWNLTVNSNAPSEPIIQDYNLMKSLASG